MYQNDCIITCQEFNKEPGFQRSDAVVVYVQPGNLALLFPQNEEERVSKFGQF